MGGPGFKGGFDDGGKGFKGGKGDFKGGGKGDFGKGDFGKGDSGKGDFGKGGDDGGKGGFKGKGKDDGKGKGKGKDDGKGKGKFKGGGGKGGKGGDPRLEGMPTDDEMIAVLTAPPMEVASRSQSLPSRPETGVLGAPVDLFANRFLTTLKTNAMVYHYDVHISYLDGPGVPMRTAAETTDPSDLTVVLQRPVLNEIMLLCSDANDWGKRWAYDGKKNVYSLDERLTFPKGGFEARIDDPFGGASTFRVQVTPVMTSFRVNPYVAVQFCQARDASEVVDHTAVKEAIMSLDVIMRHQMGLSDGYITFQTKIFPPQEGECMTMPNGGEVWYGYHQSLRPAAAGLFLNMDMFTAGFIAACPMIDFIVRELGLRHSNDLMRKELTGPDLRKLTKTIKGMKVEVTHLPYARQFRCIGLSKKLLPANQEMFDMQGKEMSVAAYFSEKYFPLKFPALPCLDLGSANKQRLVPIEVCKIKEGQRINKPTPQQASTIIREAAVEPRLRKERTEYHLQRAGFTKDETMAAFGVEVAQTMHRLRARVLPPPFIEYGDGFSIKAQLGKWNIMDVKFYDAKPMACWAVVSYLPEHIAEQPRDGPEASLKKFLWFMQNTLNTCGVTCGPPNAIVYNSQGGPGGGASGMATSLMSMAHAKASGDAGKPCDLIFVVIPDKPSELYKDTKYMSDVKLGVPSQCVVAKNAGIGCMPKRRDQYCHNVALKVNAKLGGTNSVIKSESATFSSAPSKALSWFVAEPYMIFGAANTHPASGSSAPSVAAVVASINMSATRYATRIQMNESRKGKGATQIITDLKDAVKGLLLDFYKATSGHKPARLLFYRGGVSEGEFDHVLQFEIPQIQKACAEMGQTETQVYCPPVTFVTVQQRHHGRFYPANLAQADPQGNLLPGTVVDTDVTHPYEYDFYLNSHAGIKGTNKCAHYKVLKDENGFTPDCLQLLTYRLCYSYNRATRSVSMVPPAYYAHLAAFRGRLLLCPDDDSDTNSTSASGASSGMALANIHDNLRTTMFFS